MTKAEPPIVAIRPVESFQGLAPIWTDLERRSDGSFFQSWAWAGCLAEERFTEPWLLSAHRGDKIVALALFNRAPRQGLRRGRSIHLGESGIPAQDSIFIEHNGLLLDRDEPHALAHHCWVALAQGALKSGRWVLSGVPPSLTAGLPVGSVARVRAHRPVPYRDLSIGGPSNGSVLDGLSANARQQLRRSLRGWEAVGRLTLEVAATPDEADRFLDGLKHLHQRYWTGRGKPGAFAEPFFGRFHRKLIRRTSAEQSADLIRVSAGDRVVGYLYNFVHRGWVAAYQSGFDFGPDSDRLRPGLICHLMAIDHYRDAGMVKYDFLGGEARYKRSLANAETELLWLEVRQKSPWLFGRRPVSSFQNNVSAG